MTTPSDAWPNRKLAATVVDTDPPPPVAWPRRQPAEPSPDAWATTKKPQRTPRRLGHRPQLAAAAPAQGRSAGRWIVSATLWGLAGGLLAGQSLVAHVDRGMEVGMAWLAPRAPSFLRPYLPVQAPKPVEPRTRRPLLEAPPSPETPPANEPAPKQARRRR